MVSVLVYTVEVVVDVAVVEVVVPDDVAVVITLSVASSFMHVTPASS